MFLCAMGFSRGGFFVEGSHYSVVAGRSLLRASIAVALLLILNAGCTSEPRLYQLSVVNLTGQPLSHVSLGTTAAQAESGGNLLAAPVAPGDSISLRMDGGGTRFLFGMIDGGAVSRTSAPVTLRKGTNGWLWWQEGEEFFESVEREDFLGVTDLPAFILDTDGREIPDEPRIPARAMVQDGGTIGAGPFTYDGYIDIEVRGSFSQLAPKKQWRIEAIDEEGEDIEVDFLGLEEDEDWILQGPYVDKSLIRNALVYTLGREMGHYAPHTRFCEVYLNDQGFEGSISATYEGVYVLTETVKRGSHRVPIQRLEEDDEGLPAITGGYILQQRGFDQLDEGDNWFLAGGQFYVIEYPDGDDITVEQQRYIIDYMREIDRRLFVPGFNNAETGYAPLIDVDAMVDFMLVQEWTKNIDAFKTSHFMYKRREEPLTMGPLWDFDLAFGNISLGGYESPRGFALTSLPARAWPPRLLMDPAYASRYVDRWFEVREGALSDENLTRVVDELVAELGTAPERNFLRWNVLGANIFFTFTRPQPATFAGEVDALLGWMLERAAWMDANMERLRAGASAR